MYKRIVLLNRDVSELVINGRHVTFQCISDIMDISVDSVRAALAHVLGRNAHPSRHTTLTQY